MGWGCWQGVWDLLEEGWAGRPRLLKLAGSMKGGAKIKVRSQLRKGWALGSPSIRGSESAGEYVCRGCGSPIDVAAPGRGQAGAAGSSSQGWPPVPEEPCIRRTMHQVDFGLNPSS